MPEGSGWSCRLHAAGSAASRQGVRPCAAASECGAPSPAAPPPPSHWACTPPTARRPRWVRARGAQTRPAGSLLRGGRGWGAGAGSRKLLLAPRCEVAPSPEARTRPRRAAPRRPRCHGAPRGLLNPPPRRPPLCDARPQCQISAARAPGGRAGVHSGNVPPKGRVTPVRASVEVRHGAAGRGNRWGGLATEEAIWARAARPRRPGL
jgi:hypothetical protein